MLASITRAAPALRLGILTVLALFGLGVPSAQLAEELRPPFASTALVAPAGTLIEGRYADEPILRLVPRVPLPADASPQTLAALTP